MDYPLGINAKLYFGTAGTALIGLVEATNVKDLKLGLSKGKADTTTRANSGWKSTTSTLKEATASWQMLHKTGDAALAAIRNSFLTNTPIELGILTGDRATAGNDGLMGTFEVTKFDRSEQNEEAIAYDVEVDLKVYAQWFTI